MRSRFAVISLLLLSFTSALLVDVVEVRDTVNVLSQEDSFDADDLDPYVAPAQSVRHRPYGVKSPRKMSIRATPRPKRSLVLGSIDRHLAISRPKLHTLQMVFRI